MVLGVKKSPSKIVINSPSKFRRQQFAFHFSHWIHNRSRRAGAGVCIQPQQTPAGDSQARRTHHRGVDHPLPLGRRVLTEVREIDVLFVTGKILLHDINILLCLQVEFLCIQLWHLDKLLLVFVTSNCLTPTNSNLFSLKVTHK